MTTDDFKKQLIRAGHTEKNGNQLTSGGDLNPKFLDIVSEFLIDWDKTVGTSTCRLQFTAGHDKSHQTSNPSSAHNLGTGIDFTLNTSCHDKLTQLLTTYKTKYPGFSFRDEYKNPTKWSSGPHFHIQYGGNGSKNLNVTATDGSVTDINSDESDSEATEFANRMLGDTFGKMFGL